MIRRTYLFVPGNRPDRFEKARQSGADAVIIDLEDAAQSAQKDLAREAVAAWLKPTRPVYVRINGTGTPWFERDLKEGESRYVEKASAARTARRLMEGDVSIPGWLQGNRKQVAATPANARGGSRKVSFNAFTGK